MLSYLFSPSTCTRLVLATALMFTLCGHVAYAQQDELAPVIGEWRTHLPNAQPSDVDACPEFSAWVTPGAVILRFRENNEIRRLDKANVLSQANPQLVTCNPYTPGQLIVTYEDGGIDVLQGDRLVSYTNAIEQTDIFGRRDINSVRMLAPGLAAISTGFGFLFFDPDQGIFQDDVRFESGINDVALLNDDLYLASGRGLLRLENYTQQVTLRDTASYELVDLGARTNEKVRNLVSFNDRLYIGLGSTLVSINAGRADLQEHLFQGCLKNQNLSVQDARLAVTSEDFCSSRWVVHQTSDGTNFQQATTSCSDLVLDATPRPGGGLVLASTSAGAGLCIVNETNDCDCLQLNGPNSTNTFAIAARDGIIAVAGGGLTEQADYIFSNAGAYTLRNGTWINFNNQNESVLRQDDTPDTFDQLRDFIAVAITEDSTVYAGAFFEGLIEQNSSAELTLFDQRNSSLQLHAVDTARVRVSGLDVDDAGNLWIANNGAEQSISVREPDGTWHSFDISSCGRDRVFQIVADSRTGYVYVIDFLGGVIAFDPGPDFADTSDDQCRRFESSDNLPSVDVRCLMLDRDGILWMGTADGIARLPCTGNPFDDNCVANVPTSEVDGILGTLFDDEVIRSMTSDGGNRKWIGTDNGLFLLADNTDEQLAFFTESNSPLIDNQINALAFDDESGKLWVGTNSGLMSLQTESTGSLPFLFEAVEVYPQPVRPEYEGPIAIRGLATDADVKITDAAGRLVYETNAIGGLATWDGLDYTGSRPASGVYLVWASSIVGDPPNTVVAKIALLR